MKLDLFSIPIVIENIDLERIKLEPLKLDRKWLSETPTSHGGQNILDPESYRYLMFKLSGMLEKIVPNNITIKLEAVWANRYDKDDYQDNHFHPSSHFSFIIYVKGSSRTVFFSPGKYLIDSFYSFNLFQNSFEPNCQPGQILIFPSFLEHMVKKSSDMVTYSGNLSIVEFDKRTIKVMENKNGNN
jgi:hypothetical protein